MAAILLKCTLGRDGFSAPAQLQEGPLGEVGCVDRDCLLVVQRLLAELGDTLAATEAQIDDIGSWIVRRLLERQELRKLLRARRLYRYLDFLQIDGKSSRALSALEIIARLES